MSPELMFQSICTEVLCCHVGDESAENANLHSQKSLLMPLGFQQSGTLFQGAAQTQWSLAVKKVGKQVVVDVPPIYHHRIMFSSTVSTSFLSICSYKYKSMSSTSNRSVFIFKVKDMFHWFQQYHFIKVKVHLQLLLFLSTVPDNLSDFSFYPDIFSLFLFYKC